MESEQRGRFFVIRGMLDPIHEMKAGFETGDASGGCIRTVGFREQGERDNEECQ